jgi:hypothetical protein
MSFRYSAATERIEARVDAKELAVLSALPSFLASIETDTDDIVLDRLYPTAYAEEEDDREFRRLSHGDIQRAREVDRRHLADVLERLAAGRTDVTEIEAESSARAIGVARLAIAARHGMLDEDELLREPLTPHGTIVNYLGAVQDDLIEALNQTPAMTS